MADPFNDALTMFMESCPGVKGAAFTDLDGADIALQPRSEAEALRAGAAFGGLALRRLAQAERRNGGDTVRYLGLVGDAGQFLTWAVGMGYQLVVTLKPNACASQIAEDAATTVELLEASI